jgi:hypothetical protein
MQRQAISDRRIILINGEQVGGLLTISETGIDNAPIEIPELGYTRLIQSSNKKIKQVDLAYLVKRESPTLKYFWDWFKSGGNARDVVMYFTDSSGEVTNAKHRTILGECELGNFIEPAFDEGAIAKAMLTVSLYPYTYDKEIII